MEVLFVASIFLCIILAILSFATFVEMGPKRTPLILFMATLFIPTFWYLTYQTSTFVDAQKKITYVEGVPCILDDDGKVRAIKFLRKMDDTCTVRTTTYVFKFGTTSSKRVIDAEFCQ